MLSRSDCWRFRPAGGEEAVPSTIEFDKVTGPNTTVPDVPALIGEPGGTMMASGTEPLWLARAEIAAGLAGNWNPCSIIESARITILPAAAGEAEVLSMKPPLSNVLAINVIAPPVDETVPVFIIALSVPSATSVTAPPLDAMVPASLVIPPPDPAVSKIGPPFDVIVPPLAITPLVPAVIVIASLDLIVPKFSIAPVPPVIVIAPLDVIVPTLRIPPLVPAVIVIAPADIMGPLAD